MNRRQFLKLGAAAAVAPKALAAPVLPASRFTVGMDWGHDSRSVLTVVAIHQVTGTITVEWSRELDGDWEFAPA